jgi:hypothetical protein
VHFYILQASGSQRSTATGDDFIDAVLNTSTGGSNGGEDVMGDVLVCDL